MTDIGEPGFDIEDTYICKDDTLLISILSKDNLSVRVISTTLSEKWLKKYEKIRKKFINKQITEKRIKKYSKQNEN